MTTPLKPGSYYHCQGHKVEYIGPTDSPKFVAVKYASGNFAIADRSHLTEWIEPRSFEEEREAAAKEIERLYPGPGNKLACASIRALGKPDPVSAESDTIITIVMDEKVSGENIKWSLSIREAAKLLKQIYDEWPGGLEEIEAALAHARKPDPAPAASVGLSAEPVAFDEAAERLLFEDKFGAWNSDFNKARWYAWMLSVKVRRGASPPSVEVEEALRPCCGNYSSCIRACTARGERIGQDVERRRSAETMEEVRKELLELASRLHNSPRLQFPNRYSLADELRALAAKLGAGK